VVVGVVAAAGLGLGLGLGLTLGGMDQATLPHTRGHEGAAMPEREHRPSRAGLEAHASGDHLCRGVHGLVLALQAVLGRLVTLPQQRDLDISKFPMATVFVWAAMGSVVAGVVEESAFRGYMQRPIERRHGPVVAILVTGVLFGFLHFTHPEVTLALLPFYLAVAATYGMLAYLTDSILPGLVLHAGGDIFSALNLYTTGRSEWDPAPTSRPLVWKAGPDGEFWTALTVFLIAAAAAAFAYSALAGVARRARALEPPPAA
jgi:hypothetical protein